MQTDISIHHRRFFEYRLVTDPPKHNISGVIGETSQFEPQYAETEP